jgi:hypothetical protein
MSEENKFDYYKHYNSALRELKIIISEYVKQGYRNNWWELKRELDDELKSYEEDLTDRYDDDEEEAA